MAHIQLNNDLPGIVGLFNFRPETAGPLNELAETLLVRENSLHERRKRNDCFFSILLE